VLSLLFMLQATVEQATQDVDFDLRSVPPKSSSGDTIVVTGRRTDERAPFKIPDVAPPPLLPRAETGLIGKSRIGIETDQQALANGTVSKRAMITAKIPF